MKMRVPYSTYFSTLLILLMFVTTITVVPPIYLNTNQDLSGENEFISSPPTNNQDSILHEEDQYRKINDYSIAESNVVNQGVLDPVTVEQSGYAASENLSARTDTHENLAYDLPLDSVHNWIADKAEVSVWNLEKLYVINGSFSDGYPGINLNPNGTADYSPLGWDANSTDTALYPDDLQLAVYDDSGRQFVTVESQGGKVGQNAFGHSAGVNILWTQSVQNLPYTEDYLLSFDYFYLRGPLDKNPSYPITGNCSIIISIDGTRVWNESLLTLGQRGIWTNTGVIPITITGAPASFTFEIGLEIDESLVLDKRWDYDNNGIADGIGNAAYITVYFDDVSFVKETPPTPEQVELEFGTGGLTSPLAGSSGIYTASIVNSSYWIEGPVPVTLLSNTSISFDYKTRLFSHRFTESNWESYIASTGVSYTVEHGNSSQLTMYAYVGYLGAYEDPKMDVVFPYDWENITISDPFLTEQTGECAISTGHLTVPSSLIMDYLGWWEMRFESPNYAKSVVVQKETAPSVWADETIYRVGNTTRTAVTIGTTIDTPMTVDNVNITWSIPDGSEWTTESLSGGVAGLVIGSSHILSSGLSPAGEWCVEIIWINGTEVAYDVAFFEVHHSANLVGDPELIETDAGLVFTAIVRYSDGDTSAYITDGLATISGNWSLSTVYFVANSVKNWWEVSLDTGDIGAGNFIVHIDASRPYYDAASCDILIVSTNVTRLNSPNAPWTSAQWGSESTLTFNFEVLDPETSTWGPVLNNSDVEVSLNWTFGYWSVSEDVTPGIYLVILDTSAQSSGTYLLNTTFEKPNHEPQVLFLTLIVSPVASSLVILGDPSTRVNISDDYSVKMRFANVAEIPISSGSVVIDSVNPSTGLSNTSVEEVSGEPGNYSVTLTPNAAGVYTIRFVATEANSEPASTVFVLVVNDVETILVVPGGYSFEIGLTDVFNTTFTYETTDYTGIENAAISVLYSGNTGGISWVLVEHSLGDYSIEFSATLSGTYVVTIAAFKQYYQSASDSFFLVVRDISTNLTVLNGTAGIVSYGQDYRMVLEYTNGSAWGLAGANISIESVVPKTGLDWGSTVPEEPGIYSILLTPTISNTFTVLIQASLLNHQVQFVRFTITATAIASSLTVLNTSTSIAFDQNYTVFVHYQSEDNIGLENANITIQNPPAEVSYTTFEDLGNGYYKATLNPHAIGIFDLVFRAELPGYQSDTAGFALSASRIQTELRIASGLSSEAIEYLQTSEFSVIFERTDFSSNITGADITIQMAPSTGLNWSYHESSGAYHIALTPNHIGRWTLTVSASKLGYALGSVQYILDVGPVTITATLLSSFTAIEGNRFPIIIRLTQEGTTIPVVEALVEYRMTALGAPVGNFEVMEGNGTPGVYEAWFTFPLYQSDTQFSLEVRVSKDNFELSGGTFQRDYSKTIDIVLRWTPVITSSGFILAAFVFSLVGLRAYNTRKRRKNLEALQVKKRFDDVSNILGIIVLHKNSGLPVYSKMIKGGFEEAMVSAFITAITHFRSEFEMNEKHWDFNVIPISDIISTVPTRNLIVAFITVRPPSKFQEVGMEAFGRATGAMFDELLADQKTAVIDSEQNRILNTMFYDLLDGFLIETFRTSKSVEFPKKMQCLQTAAEHLENGDGFKLDDLAREMATCGIEESRAYKIVMDAIDDDLIEIVESDTSDLLPNHTPIYDIRDTDDDEEFET